MKLYLLTVGIASIIVSGANILVGTAPWYYVIAQLAWCIAVNFMLDGLFAILIKIMPNKWFLPDNPAYHVSEKERSIYRKLKVRSWKDKVWELGGIGGFSKKNIKEPGNPKYIERFIIECNKGVLTHRLSYLSGVLVMFTCSGVTAFTIALPAALVNLYLNILPTIVLRYNTPMLKSVLLRLKRKAERIDEDEAVLQQR